MEAGPHKVLQDSWTNPSQPGLNSQLDHVRSRQIFRQHCPCSIPKQPQVDH